jgi:hypothetical protein
MEKLSEKLRERCDNATKAANAESEPDSYWDMGEAQAYSDAAQLAEAHEAEWRARVEEVVAELRERSAEEERRIACSPGTEHTYRSGRKDGFDQSADLVAEKLLGGAS